MGAVNTPEKLLLLLFFEGEKRVWLIHGRGLYTYLQPFCLFSDFLFLPPVGKRQPFST